MYIKDKLGSHTISLKTGIGKAQILNLLKENSIELRKSGRSYIGGVKEANKRYHTKHKKKVREYHASWATENREHLREYHKQWRDENIEHHREVKRNYERTRKANDPIYKLIGNFRTAIYTVLKENNMSKYDHYFDMLGYSQEDLVSHLDFLLNDGMTWENYGEWHVDHKLPIDSFNFRNSKDPEFKECWSLNNLQPMWGSENISKGTNIL